MAQKSNPISLRLRKTNKLWNSCWYGDYNYTTQLLQDRGVEAHIQNICRQARMAPPVVFLNRQRQQTSTFFFFSRQQKISHIKRPSRGTFQKSVRKGYDWLHKLLFWSCKAPVYTPGAVNNNSACPDRKLVQFASGNKTRVEKRLESSPFYSSGEFFRLFPYLLLSSRSGATPQGEPASLDCLDCAESRYSEIIPPTVNLEVGQDKQQPRTTLHLSPYRPWRSTPAAQPPKRAGMGKPPYPGHQLLRRFAILPTLKKKSQSTNPHTPLGQEDTTPTLRYAPPAFHSPNVQQQAARWGFFAMRSQYSLRFQGAESISPAAYFAGMSRPSFPGRVQSGRPPLAGPRSSPPWRNHLESCISAQTHHNSTLHFLLCPSVHQNPLFLATQLCFSLENRKTFRRLKDRLMQDISADSSIKGVRITCSGRVAARSKKAQKAKTESIQWGQTSLNVFSDLVNFASKSALTPFGKIGVKVWICYQEKPDRAVIRNEMVRSPARFAVRAAL